MADMGVNICGVAFKNPVIAASGTFGFGREYQNFYDVSLLGGISVKGLTRLKRQGNPPARVAETPSGMLNSVGLQNPGVEAFIADDLPWLKQQGTVVIANMAGACEDDYVYMADRLSHSDVDMLEMNISCPNVKEGGVAFGTRPESIYNIVKLTKPAAKKPLIVKLSPNVADIAECARAAEEAGADALLIVTPYYNKCSQSGLIAHYTAIMDAVNIPCVLYNVPSRTGVNVKPETLYKLCKHRNCAAMKEASGNISQVAEMSRL